MGKIHPEVMTMTLLIRRQASALVVVAVVLAAMTAPALAQTSDEAVIVGTVSGVVPETKSFFVTTEGGREIMVIAPSHALSTNDGYSIGKMDDVRLSDRVWVRGTVIDARNLTAGTIVILPAMESSQQIDRE
jgi:hypothetical protein